MICFLISDFQLYGLSNSVHRLYLRDVYKQKQDFFNVSCTISIASINVTTIGLNQSKHMTKVNKVVVLTKYLFSAPHNVYIHCTNVFKHYYI